MLPGAATPYAYRYDLIGSLIGTTLSAALSFLGEPPVVWSLFIAAATMALSSIAGDIWSPYYKIQTSTGTSVTLLASRTQPLELAQMVCCTK